MTPAADMTRETPKDTERQRLWAARKRVAVKLLKIAARSTAWLAFFFSFPCGLVAAVEGYMLLAGGLFSPMISVGVISGYRAWRAAVERELER